MCALCCVTLFYVGECVVMDSLHILCFVVRTQSDGMDFLVKNKPFHRVVLLIVCILLVYVFER